MPCVPAPKRILVIRLDRLGDVVLSTPVLQALREHVPHAFIAMMVRPACRDVVAGHPSLNEVIVYEKEGAQRSLLGTVRFARGLRRYAFDTALILHPTNRSHWIPRLAGIPVRIGYNRKSAWLLTHRLPHRKQRGDKHEAEYTLELLRIFGLHPGRPHPLVSVQAGAQERLASVLTDQGFNATARVVAIHPAASCPSKRWMPERFAEVADRLIEQVNVQVVLVAGVAEIGPARAVEGAMRHRALNLAGKLSVAELAALLQRCALLISNDSGPVHVAAAVGTPVVAIFGRNQRGLSSRRWGPLGEGHVILQKDVGCVTCLAQNCDIGFLCLASLSVEDVSRAAIQVLAKNAPQS
ncbi:MAG: lipopolysaccharide heptosyltransferase II [Candidatus Omnitrophica bacterium]|nr:lipopolysaccharide heptosyltransferase II [Candidatus Omnitrophota bacterium]